MNKIRFVILFVCICLIVSSCEEKKEAPAPAAAPELGLDRSPASVQKPPPEEAPLAAAPEPRLKRFPASLQDVFVEPKHNLATGRAFLFNGTKEEKGYALYSYILFAHQPNQEEKPKYLMLLERFLYIPKAKGLLAEGVNKDELNITYLPVKKEIKDMLSGDPKKDAEIVLEYYDYEKASALLHKVGTHVNGGPFIISSMDILSKVDKFTAGYLKQDLSSANRDNISRWVDEFIVRAAENNWKAGDSLNTFFLQFRDFLAHLYDGTEVSKKNVEKLIEFIKTQT